MSGPFVVNIDGKMTENGLQINGTVLAIDGEPVGVLFGSDKREEYDFIVRAANAHEAMKEALSEFLAEVDEAKRDGVERINMKVENELFKMMRTALSLARGEQQ